MGRCLVDFGIHQHHSHRWQQIAGIEEARLEACLAATRAVGEERTTADLLRLALWLSR